MSHWNYRMTRRMLNGEPVYEISEVFYDDEDDEKFTGMTEPLIMLGSTLEEAEAELLHMLTATHRPVWDLDAKEWVETPLLTEEPVVLPDPVDNGLKVNEWTEVNAVEATHPKQWRCWFCKREFVNQSRHRYVPPVGVIENGQYRIVGPGEGEGVNFCLGSRWQRIEEAPSA